MRCERARDHERSVWKGDFKSYVEKPRAELLPELGRVIDMFCTSNSEHSQRTQHELSQAFESHDLTHERPS